MRADFSVRSSVLFSWLSQSFGHSLVILFTTKDKGISSRISNDLWNNYFLLSTSQYSVPPCNNENYYVEIKCGRNEEFI